MANLIERKSVDVTVLETDAYTMVVGIDPLLALTAPGKYPIICKYRKTGEPFVAALMAHFNYIDRTRLS